MQPVNYDKIIQSTGGRWVPVYKRLFDSPFWREKPEFKHFINMAETGVPVSYAGAPTPAAGEVLNTHVIPKMIQRVLVDNWEPAKALDECDKRIVEIYGDLDPPCGVCGIRLSRASAAASHLGRSRPPVRARSTACSRVKAPVGGHLACPSGAASRRGRGRGRRRLRR